MAGSTQEERQISLQEREVHRFFQPWLDAHGSSLNVASHVESIAQHDLHGQGYRPRSSRDKALVAFAQLAVQRLNVKRATISLIDPTQQFILAEATRASFSGHDGDIWLGSTVLSRPDAVCEHCMSDSCTARDDDGQTYTCPGLIIDDCRLDARFEDRPYVKHELGVRFYAGVPIVSRGGHKIGAYAVSDVKPRNGLAVDELHFMQEIAQGVMEHLEWARDRVDRFKGERIVRGMAAFIEGASSTLEGPVMEVTHEASGSASAGLHPKPHSRASDSGKVDRLSKMFDRAAKALRESTLADGAVLFGASAGSVPRAPTKARTAKGSDSSSGDPQPSMTPPSTALESERHGAASESDAASSTRPCKLLALSLAEEGVRSGIEQKSPLSLGTLEKYYSLFPRGRTFHFNEQGLGISSGDESTSDRDAPRHKKGRMDHRELLKKIPDAQSVTFLPLYDYADERLMAGCFLWTSATGRMMSLDGNLAYLHAFGNIIMSEVARVKAEKTEAAKTTFIASMSHELRSPLHGILGATEFLQDTATDAYQSGLITSIMTCGKTLLDTLNHVLDYSKINKLGRAQMRKNAKQNKLVTLTSDALSESMNIMAEVDLGVLVEEVVEAVVAGHAFKKQHNEGIGPDFESSTNITLDQAVVRRNGMSDKSPNSNQTNASAEGDTVSVLLDIMPKQSWGVRTQPGALRRIIMNLLGNSLKYTTSGFVAVSLRAQETEDRSKIDTYIRVVDSGKGISDDFLKNKLFVAFSQEDSFQPGTGLGLSIVKQIVDSLGGSVDVKSKPGVGTEIGVHLSLMPASDHSLGAPDSDILSTATVTRGLELVILDPSGSDDARTPSDHVTRLEETLAEVCSTWFDMRVRRSPTIVNVNADVFLYSEPPSVKELLQAHEDGVKSAREREIPIIIICVNAEEALNVARNQSKNLGEAGRVIEAVPQPCGPRKLAKVLGHCMRRVEELVERDGGRKGASALADVRERRQTERGDDYEEAGGAKQEPVSRSAWCNDSSFSDDKRRRLEPDNPPRDTPLSAAVSFPSPRPLDPGTPLLRGWKFPDFNEDAGNALPDVASPGDSQTPQPPPTPHILLTDDNSINLQLLVMFMKKLSYSYAKAENGQEALDAYRTAAESQQHRPFDFILMDISMPVMDGYEATRRIREFEREKGMKPTTVIALTGLASAQAQREAEMAGMDIFLPKPVKFAGLKKLMGAG